MHTFKKGDRVETIKGPGTIIGFESFDAKGMSAPLADTPRADRERIAVTLDPGHSWAYKGGDFYEYPEYLERTQ